MIAVDTSVWIAYLRRGDATLQQAMNALLDEDRVSLPAIVRLELAAGTSPRHSPRLLKLLGGVHAIETLAEDWRRAEQLALAGAQVGERFGAADLLIVASVGRLGHRLWTHDSDFARMEKLGWCRVWIPGSA